MNTPSLSIRWVHFPYRVPSSLKRLFAVQGAGSDLGYPSTVELPNGEFVTVWYERLKDSPRAVLRKAQWSIG
jgi:hypothetical protein